jgi:hypothetical protein
MPTAKLKTPRKCRPARQRIVPAAPPLPAKTQVHVPPHCAAALDRIKTIHGINKGSAVTRGVFLLKEQLKGFSA